MTETETGHASVAALDDATTELVRLAAVITVGDEEAVREALERAAAATPHEWIEELILQSYLFAGFPRTLNAARDWRRISGRRAPDADQETEIGDLESWEARGEATCSTVYGPFYEGLRRNIRTLHPAHEDRTRGEAAFMAGMKRHFAERLAYRKLEVLDSQPPDAEGLWRVLFLAHVSRRGKDVSFAELSTFAHDGVGLRYLAGRTFAPAELGARRIAEL